MIPHRNKIIAAIAVVALAIVSFKLALAYQISSIAETYGFSNVQLYIEDVGLSGIKIKDLRIGGDDRQMVIPEVSITYTLYQLLEYRVDKIVIKRPYIDAHVQNSKLSVVGLESLLQEKPGETSATFVLSPNAMNRGLFRFNDLTIEDASLRMLGYGADTSLRFDLTMKSSPVPQIHVKIPPFTGKYNGYPFSVSDIAADITLNEKEAVWLGKWNTKGASISGTPSTVPDFRIKGDIEARAAIVTSDIMMESDQSPIKLDASLKIKPNQSVFMIKTVSLPWADGMISTHNIVLPVRENKILNAMVSVSRLSLDKVLQILTGNRAKATGVISGNLPVGINSNGGIIFYTGELRADGPGVISVKPEAIPSDNAQIQLLRTVLGNFHYNNLLLKLESGEGNNLEVMLKVDGNNPDAYKGRPVKLNVHLTGDLLNLIQQTILPVTNPEQLLKQKAQ